MITKTLNALRGYNGVAKIPDNISIGGVDVAPAFVYRTGQGVGPDLGPELVTDGDMEAAGTAAWPGGSSDLTAKSTVFPVGGLQCLDIVCAPTSTFAYSQQQILTIGDYFIVEAYARSNDSVSFIRMSEGSTILWDFGTSTDWQRKAIIFQATGEYLKFTCRNTLGGSASIDQISVKKINPVYGADLITNGDFADWTGDDPDDWILVGETATSIVTEDPLGCRIISDGSNISIRQVSVVIGRTYRAIIDIAAVGSGSIRFEDGTQIILSNLGNVAQYVEEFVAGSDYVRFIRNTACDVTIGNIVVQEIHYNGGYLPPHTPSGAETLYETGTGAAIDWDVPSYGNGPDDRAIRGNGSVWLKATSGGFADIDTQDFIFRFALRTPLLNANEYFLAKRGSATGYWRIRVNSSGTLNISMTDSVGSYVAISSATGAIKAGQATLCALVVDRTGSGQLYVEGVASGSPATVSALLSLSNTEPMDMLLNPASGSPYYGEVLYASLHMADNWLDSHLQDDWARDDFQKWCDEYPDLALGTPNPTFLQAETTYIEEYDPADGFISLHNTSEDVLPVGRVRDLAGGLFYGYRLAGYVENLIPYSNDLSNAAWIKTRMDIFTGELVETPVPGVFYQGLVPTAVTGTHSLIDVWAAASSTEHITAFFARKEAGTWLMLFNGTTASRVNFDLENGAIGVVTGFSSYGMVPYGNDHYLCWGVENVAAGAHGCQIYAAINDNSLAFPGDGITVHAWISFIQVESGIYPNPRILTEGAADIRNEDSLGYKTDDGAIPDPSKFFLQFEYLNQYGPPVAMHPLCTIGDAVDHEIQIDNGGRIDVNVGELTSITSITDGYKHKIGLWVDGSHADLYIDDTIEDTTEGFLVAASLVYLLFAVADRGGQQSAPQWVRDVNLYTDNPYLRLYADEAQEGDVLLYQTTDDGEMNIVEGVTEMTPTFDTMFYLSLFGGNEDDPGGSDTTKQWWGNIDEPDPAYQYRSRTQHILRSTNANSTNLKRLENAAIFDLTRDFTDTGIGSDLTVAVSIPRLNRVNISGTINADGETIPFKFTANWEASV